jgi:hypothetical protein
MSELYDDTHVVVAASHALFVHHYCSQGELDKAQYANTLAIRILEQLIYTRPHEQSSCGMHYKALYLHCLSISIELDPRPFVSRVMQFEHLLKLAFWLAGKIMSGDCFTSLE